jgi:hypothetical protein
MNRCRLFLVCLLLGLSPVYAQVTVEVLQDQDQFLQGEDFLVKVRITNRSGQTLHLGNSEDWLTFSIESLEGAQVVKTGEAPVLGEFTLESSKIATKRADLSPFFSLNQNGRYAVTATIRIAEWDRQINSKPKNFDIIEGSRLWEQDFGVPKTADSTNAVPEVRKYILHQANYLKSHLHLYLRLTDATGSKTYRVFPIGPMVSFSRPEPQLDQLSNLHLLFQNGARSFSYTVFSPNGSLLVRQSYEYSTSRPRLQVDGSGNVSIVGGTRRAAIDDYPPTSAPASTNVPPSGTASPDVKPQKS